jgi:tetratricopeptide (TPR) repeat protein
MGQAKDDPCLKMKSDSEIQQCHAVAQIAPQLRSAAQIADAGVKADDSAGLSYNVHMSDCEGRWVALYHKPEDGPQYTFGFVYIDPQAGFTLEFGGYFTIHGDGSFHAIPDPIHSNKAAFKIRLEQNGVAALLPHRALEELGLQEKPGWLKYYEDTANPVTHKVNWGFHYNAIGDSRRALDYLESAYDENPNAPRVVIELAYAYNALGRPGDALRVLKNEFAKKPKDELLCREMAYADLKLKNYKEATEQYPLCIALCDDSETGMAERSELASDLSAAYNGLGDTASHDAWVEKAKSWAPKGSPVYKYFHPDQQ